MLSALGKAKDSLRKLICLRKLSIKFLFKFCLSSKFIVGNFFFGLKQQQNSNNNMNVYEVYKLEIYHFFLNRSVAALLHNGNPQIALKYTNNSSYSCIIPMFLGMVVIYTIHNGKKEEPK